MIAGLRVALIVPTLNEAEAIGPALSRAPRALVDRVIVADGGSADETVAHAEAAGAEVVKVGRGYGRACWEGASAAAADCEILAFMDGDGADPAEHIGLLLEPIARGERDFVIGSRTRGVRAPGSLGAHQIFAGYAIGALLGVATGVRYSDMCAFRAIRRDAFLALGMREMTFGWNLEMQARAARRGLRVLEVPVPYGARVAGRSKVAGSVKGTARATASILSTLFTVLREPVNARTNP